ncbi:MAG TPA: methyltransferase domain-containing protein [bacterium]|nr:methyltransferase domain-containing protein [bacterium]
MKPWDWKAGWYPSVRRLPLIGAILNSEIRSLKTLLAESGVQANRILDVGAGAGDSWAFFSGSASGVGVDLSFGMLKRARSRFPKLDLVSARGDALPFRDGCFPFLSLVGVAEYVRDKKKLLGECGRVLAPAGHLLVTVPAAGPFTVMRNLLGSRIHPVEKREWEARLAKDGWHMRGFRETWLQRQYLLRKNNPQESFPP